MFLNNKYKTWHDNIISKAKLRTEERIYEIHHIIPKYLKGSNDESNLVKLNPKEHYIVHMLLCKFTKGYARHKMIFAFQAMANQATKAGVEGHGSKIVAPLLHLTKADIIRAGSALGVDYSQTVSCYQADELGRACGRCDSCRLRKEGFAQAGLNDPTRYV